MAAIRCLCRVFVILIAVMATLHCVSASAKELSDQDVLANLLKSASHSTSPGANYQSAYDQSLSEDAKSCFHFYVARNMSSLLSVATKMLRQVRDRLEREWLLTFIYRIKSLAEHLRSHPEARNYGCLPFGDEERRKSPNGEIYFEDAPLSKRGNADTEQRPGEPVLEQLSRVSDNQVSTKSATQTILHEAQSPPTAATSTEGETATKNSRCCSFQDQKRATNQALRPEQNIAPESWPDNDEEDDSLVKEIETGYQLNLVNPADLKAGLVNAPLTLSPAGYQLYMKHHSQQRKETIQSILEDMALQIRKLKAIGGTEEDIQKIWKLSLSDDENTLKNDVLKRHHEEGHSDDEESGAKHLSGTAHHNLLVDEDEDFGQAELGAAAGALEPDDQFLPKDRTVAPSLGEVLNSKEQSVDGNDEQEDILFQDGDDDVLVKQLEGERYNPVGTTRALNGRNSKPLTSTDSILIFD